MPVLDQPHAESVAVLGVGNVGLDVARILAKTADELLVTEIPDNVKEGLTIIPVTHVREVLKQALVRTPEPVEWDEAAEEAAAASRAASEPQAGQLPH